MLGAKPKGGVFAVGYTDDPYQRRMLDWFPPEIGPGPFYVLTRPYHLVHLESMRSVLEVATGGKSLVAPRYGMCTVVVCYAKRALDAGDLIDGPGGFASYGLIENFSDGAGSGLPICLSKGARLRRPIAENERIGWDDVDPLSVSPEALAAWRQASAMR